ncbi:toluene tolerance family protein [Oleiphilus messinensis]|uniref:Toluene tolerance family protein n=1 Tax=Oleiphilus messinensis TaxID=141451 RepID=A0A1Y0I916_9GAMM|nr:ABC transporter substrate-binding protein [Oleiphilus messinensis]ARU55975.1 toluene tolerance family protein [Oleiphilus messinensis]
MNFNAQPFIVRSRGAALLQSCFQNNLQWLALALIAILPMTAAADEAEKVKQIIANNTVHLMKTLEDNRSTYSESPDVFYGNMEAALAEVIDFRRIAARVMGKYARHASKQQRNDFVETFKRSLFETYAQALVNSGKFEVNVLAAKIISPEGDRASVDLEIVTAEGATYPVMYSMYVNDKKAAWMLENIIVNGVNVGLAFRDRFEQEMRNRKGNIDLVIANWNAKIDSGGDSQVN